MCDKSHFYGHKNRQTPHDEEQIPSFFFTIIEFKAWLQPRRFRVTIGRLVAGSIPGRAYVKEIPSAEHKNNRVLWVVELSATSTKTQYTE